MAFHTLLPTDADWAWNEIILGTANNDLQAAKITITVVCHRIGGINDDDLSVRMQSEARYPLGERVYLDFVAPSNPSPSVLSPPFLQSY